MQTAAGDIDPTCPRLRHASPASACHIASAATASLINKHGGGWKWCSQQDEFASVLGFSLKKTMAFLRLRWCIFRLLDIIRPNTYCIAAVLLLWDFDGRRSNTGIGLPQVRPLKHSNQPFSNLLQGGAKVRNWDTIFDPNRLWARRVSKWNELSEFFLKLM